MRPAKKVEAARAVCSPRKLKIADAVQLIMIRTINMMSTDRKRAGVIMSESYTIVSHAAWRSVRHIGNSRVFAKHMDKE